MKYERTKQIMNVSLERIVKNSCSIYDLNYISNVYKIFNKIMCHSQMP